MVSWRLAATAAIVLAGCGAPASPPPVLVPVPTASSPCSDDLTTSADHCGTCDHACGKLQVCRASTCQDAPDRIVAGTGHACWLHAGRVACWGTGDAGQLGPGTRGRAAAPTYVRDIDDAVDLSAGDASTCVVRRTGEEVCFGSPEHRRTPADASACTLTSKGTVTCAGRHPSDVPNLSDATEVATGAKFACATRATGRPVCWGSNADGALGIGETSFFPAPTPVPGIDDAVEVATVESATCVRRRNGHVACWGGRTAPDVWAPAEVPDLAAATHLFAGFSDVCASRAGGGVVCFAAGHDVAADPKRRDVPGRPSRVAARGIPGIGLRGGQAYYFDESGKETKTSPVLGISDVAAVQATYRDACALSNKGDVACWEAPEDLDIGKPLHPVLRHVKIPPAADLGGYSNECAVLRSGEVTCWGTGEDEAPRTLSGLTGALTVRSSGMGLCALLADGRVWCSASLVGERSERWQGQGIVPDLADAVSVDVASHHACAVTRAGKVLCWGSNVGHVLGRPERASSQEPVEVKEPVDRAGR